MNGFPYDAFSVMPRTPSPGSSSSSPEVVSFQLSPSPYDAVFGSASGGVPAPYSHGNGFQHSADIAAPVWQQSLHGGPIMQAAPGHAGRPSLLQELYDHELPPDHLPHPHSQGPPSQHDGYLGHSAEPHYGSGGDWPAVTPPSSSHGLPPSPHALPPMRSPHESMVRRNTFPYVRHDHEQSVQFAHHPPPPPHYVDHPPPMMGQFGGRPDMVYGEPLPMGNGHHMPLSAEPSALHGSRMDDGYGPPMHHHHHHHHPHHHQSPHGGYREFDDSGVKIEDNGPVMVPSQPFYRPQPSGGMPMSYLSPHAAIPIQHTDDAASKETQYLRRRCFNCHTTEPPSWRRSTLNPGKIVCNKCGLYERTHLRPRPLRFDELRAGNKARKAAAKTAASPKSRPAKKEGPLSSDGGISRRASVSSTASSVGGASSDWDDGASVYSNGSGSSVPSPAQSTFSIPRDSASASPPMTSAESGIRLPAGGLNSFSTPPPPGHEALAPRRSATTGSDVYYTPYGSQPLPDPYRRNTVNLPIPSGMPAPPPADDIVQRLPPMAEADGQGPPPAPWQVSSDDATPTQMASPKELSKSVQVA